MFDVLTFVYDHYAAGTAYPKLGHIERQLQGVGFERTQVEAALSWLHGLDSAAHPSPLKPWLVQPDPSSVRIYPAREQAQLGSRALRFIQFLESAGALPAHMREVVIERATAAAGQPTALNDLKIIILMVYWRFGYEPDALVLDELCDDTSQRVPH
jgi:Smg protein